jgi:hypothetical protein
MQRVYLSHQHGKARCLFNLVCPAIRTMHKPARAVVNDSLAGNPELAMLWRVINRHNPPVIFGNVVRVHGVPFCA